jgi:hypothetical protein
VRGAAGLQSGRLPGLAAMGAISIALLGMGCYPTLNWREVRPDATELRAMFPCKPAQQTRAVALAGATVNLTLVACVAGGATYAIGHADMGNPQRTTAALSELADSAERNLQAARVPAVAWQIEGMTPNERAGKLMLHGKLPDGTDADEQLVLFAKDTRVFQATVLGKKIDPEAAEMFFGGLRLPS